jgi:predicted kinase
MTPPRQDGGVTSPAVGDPHGPLVVLMCGVAGSGKTTYAQRLEAQGYVRLSIDEEVWHRFGRYSIDYDPGEYAALSRAAEDAVRTRLLELVAQGRDVVLDLSFWQRASREQYKRLVQDAGGRWRLVHLQVAPDVLRRRLAERAHRFDANAAFPITDETLTGYLSGFEAPHGEGEEVITVES